MRRLTAIVLGAMALGVLLSLLKGTGGGARLQFGNLSAPWLAIGFFAGARYARVGRAAAAGILATVAALVGFYAQHSALWDFSSASLGLLGHPSQLYDFIVGPHRIVFIGGIATGAMFGALGALWAAHRSRLVLIAVALLFVCEPVAWLGLSTTSGGRTFGPLGHYWWIWLVESAIGLAAIAMILYRRRTAEQTAGHPVS